METTKENKINDINMENKLEENKLEENKLEENKLENNKAENNTEINNKINNNKMQNNKNNIINNKINKKQPFKIFGVEFVYLFILGIFCALFGWLGENTFKLISDGFIDSRFHILPLIPAYSLIVFAIYIFLGSASDISFCGKKLFKKQTLKTKIISNILSYIIICFAVFVGELVVGNMWDLCFGVKLWDYSGYFLAITQYTSLLTTLMYGTIAFLLFQILHPSIRFVKKHISYNVAKWICIVVGSLMIADELRMAITIMATGESMQFWKLVFFKP